jgi:hypothetical protein
MTHLVEKSVTYYSYAISQLIIIPLISQDKRVDVHMRYRPYGSVSGYNGVGHGVILMIVKGGLIFLMSRLGMYIRTVMVRLVHVDEYLNGFRGTLSTAIYC